MEVLPDSVLALASLTFALGVKHGFDADHLATIDGLTRFHGPERPRLARWCGVLFSAGHGAVVIAIAITVGEALERWTPPEWAEGVGSAISLGFLFALGGLNLWSVFTADPADVVRPVGLRSRLFGRGLNSARPASIALIGALFALSFDTMSQAALFAVAGAKWGGALPALALGVLFLAGMAATDGVNGWWIARLLCNADRRARIASRVMGLVVGWLSLGVGLWGLARLLSPAVAGWGEGRELYVGSACIATVALSFLVAVKSAERGTTAGRSA